MLIVFLAERRIHFNLTHILISRGLRLELEINFTELTNTLQVVINTDTLHKVWQGKLKTPQVQMFSLYNITIKCRLHRQISLSDISNNSKITS